MDEMASGPDNVRYSNLGNINSVIDGDMKSTFFVRKPIFSEFQGKSIASLLWQLYLVVPEKDREDVRTAIQQMNQIVQQIQRVRYAAAAAAFVPVPKPQGMTAAQREAQDDRDDKLKQDFGQSTIYREIHTIAQSDRWRKLSF